MSPNASILVQDNVALRMENVVIRGCNGLWNSISLRSNARLEAQGCTISDAREAIKVDGFPAFNIDLKNNAFKDNYVCLRIANANTSVSTTGINTMKFGSLMSGSLPSGYLGSTAISYLNGTAAAERFHIEDYDYGVYFDGNTAPVVSACNFSRLRYGVFAKTTDGSHQIISNSFDQVGYGYYELSPHGCLFFQHNILTNVTTNALYSSNRHAISNITDACLPHAMQIKDNEMHTNKSDCIKIIDEVGEGSISINDNFLFPGEQTVGSHNLACGVLLDNIVQSSVSVHAGVVKIFGNIVRYTGPITDQGRRGGIHLRNVVTSEIPLSPTGKNIILENEIYANHNKANSHGIYLANTPEFDIVENRVIGWTTTPKYLSIPHGIRVENSANTALSCNHIDRTNRGVCFSLMNSNTSLETTIFNKHGAALYYESNARTDAQFLRGNNWNNSDQNFDGFYVGDAFNCGLSFYHISPSNTGASLQFTVTQAQPSDWRVILPNPEPNCVGDFTGGGDDNSITPGDTYAMNPMPDGQSGVLHWEAKRQTYAKLVKYPALAATGLASQFFAQAQGGDLGAFTAVENGFRHLLDIPTSFDQAGYNTALSNLNTVNATIDGLMGQIDQNPTGTVFQQLIAQLNTARQQQDALVAARNNYKQQLQQAYTTKLNALLAQNQALVADTDFKQTEKDINAIWISLLLHGASSLTEANQQTVAQVAAQCPLLGGRGVYRARTIQSVLTGNVDYSDTDECVGGGIDLFEQFNDSQDRSTETASTKETFQITPNPADQALVLATDCAGLIQVYNLSGSLVLEMNTPIGTTTIPTDAWSNGAYLIRFLAEGATPKSLKLIVQH